VASARLRQLDGIVVEPRRRVSASVDPNARPRLARGVRLRQDRLTGKFLLLRPETGFELRGSALDVVRLCDGASTVASMVEQLAKNHVDAARSQIAEDVARLLDQLLARRLIAVDADRSGGMPDGEEDADAKEEAKEEAKEGAPDDGPEDGRNAP